MIRHSNVSSRVVEMCPFRQLAFFRAWGGSQPKYSKAVVVPLDENVHESAPRNPQGAL